jgi:hypothetical protein
MDLKFLKFERAGSPLLPILTFQGTGEAETLKDAASLAANDCWPKRDSQSSLPLWISEIASTLTPGFVYQARTRRNKEYADNRGLFLYQRLIDFAIHERRSHADDPAGQRIKVTGEEAMAAITALRLLATVSPERVVHWPTDLEVGATAVSLCMQIDEAYQNPQLTQDISYF